MVYVPYTIDQKPLSVPLSRERALAGQFTEHSSFANSVPISSAPIPEIAQINASKRVMPEQNNHSFSKIFSTRSAPSTISSESALKARAIYSSEFIHNEAQTRIARSSNLYVEAPRFRNDVDLLA